MKDKIKETLLHGNESSIHLSSIPNENKGKEVKARS